jgi:outer membrane protein OmpA-like peptidoglycan-associated protein
MILASLQSAGAQTTGGHWQTPGPIQTPKGTWQTPGQIQTPKGTWQTPRAIQVPKGIQAIKTTKKDCFERMAVGADALFEFNQSKLTADAAETLNALGPMIQKAGKHPVFIEGHTDAIGSDAYNQKLSEARATAVKKWLVAHRFVSEAATIRGWGKRRPVAPNTKPDGTDDPAGRQRNRRVEVVIDTCH